MTRSGGGPRSWTWTTRVKLETLEEYLSAFTKACAGKSEEIVYIDLFAGGLENFDRDTGTVLLSSARLACRASPPFTRLRFVEVRSKAEQLRVLMQREFPGRDIKVFGGDCNERIDDLLADLGPVNWAPTFAFVDPDGMEVRWDTIRKLAAHKRQGRTKVEIWMLFAAPGIMRTLTLDNAGPKQQDLDRADQLFGTVGWEAIYRARKQGLLSPTDARREYVNLMRWLLEQELGYKHTHAIEFKNTGGSPMYSMVFASDSDPGERIMRHLYRNALEKYPQMQQEIRREREREQGVMSLFGPDGLAEFDAVPSLPAHERYEPTPVQVPYGWVDPQT